MKKGIVMEVKSDTLVMMTPDGEFIKAKKQPSMEYAVGEELTFFPKTETKSKSILQELKKKIIVKPVLSGAAALLMLFFILFPGLHSSEVYAYVSVDINPSFEISVSKDSDVLEIKPFNEEAEKILSSISDWKGLSLVEITEDIIELCDENGYMDEQKNVTVTTVFTEEASNSEKSTLKTELAQFTEEKIKDGTAKIAFIDSDKTVREEAHKAGMTAGQFLKKKDSEEDTSNGENEASQSVAKPAEQKENPGSAENDKEQPSASKKENNSSEKAIHASPKKEDVHQGETKENWHGNAKEDKQNELRNKKEEKKEEKEKKKEEKKDKKEERENKKKKNDHGENDGHHGKENNKNKSSQQNKNKQD
ncbi:anti-sigma factor domain-containing protein [Bacillus sp. AK031]